MRTGLRLWLLAFVGFFLLFGAWSFATPYDGPPDEQAHALRAAALGHGQVFPTGDRTPDAAGVMRPSDPWTLETPSSLWRTRCFPMFVTVPADCSAEPGGDETLEPHKVSAAHYNPFYYWVTAWPVAAWPNWTGILLARLLNGAAMAALLSSAVVAACRWTRHRAVVAGLVVAATPMVAHLGGAINPNGIEIAAGVGLFAGLIPLLLEPQTRVNRAALALVGISAGILVTPRSLGVMWLVIILATMLIGTSRTRLRELAGDRSVRRWAALVAVSVVASGVWTLIARPQRLPEGDLGLTPTQILRSAVIDVWPNMVNQMVGVMGWAETLQPRLVYVAWFMAAGLLVLGGFLLGDRTDRLRMLVLSVGTFVPLLGQELLLVNQIGWFNQGRYFLPGAVGLPMLGAYALARRGLDAGQIRLVTRTLAVVLVPIHVVCLAYTMTRWQSGLASLNPLEGSWMPPLGPVVPLVLGAAAVVVLVFLYWRASGGTRQASDVTPEPASEVEGRQHGGVLAAAP